MAQRILALFNLKPGTSVQDYEKWAQTVDIPTVNGLGSIEKFEVYKVTGMLFSEEKPPYDYFELLDILDMDQFGSEAGSEIMQKVAAEFQSMVHDLIFMTSEAF